MSEHVLIVKKKTFEEVQNKRMVLDSVEGDVAFQEGDLLTLEEFDFEAEAVTGRTIRAKAGSIYIARNLEPDTGRYSMFAILPIDE